MRRMYNVKCIDGLHQRVQCNSRNQTHGDTTKTTFFLHLVSPFISVRTTKGTYSSIAIMYLTILSAAKHLCVYVAASWGQKDKVIWRSPHRIQTDRLFYKEQNFLSFFPLCIWESIQPFLHSAAVWQSEKLTDTPRYGIIGCNRTHEAHCAFDAV